MPILYHYTSATAYQALKPLLESPEIDNGRKVAAILRPSRQALSGDAHYGDGWYLTDIQPFGAPFGGDRLKIARALWDGSFEQNYAKTEYFIGLKIHGNTRIEEPRRHVFFISVRSQYRPDLDSYGPVPQPEKLPPYIRWPRTARQKQGTNIGVEQNRGTSEHGSLFQRFKRWLGF